MLEYALITVCNSAPASAAIVAAETALISSMTVASAALVGTRLVAEYD